MAQERERENLFAKSNNEIASNITEHTTAGCQRTDAHLCWPPMTKEKTKVCTESCDEAPSKRRRYTGYAPRHC